MRRVLPKLEVIFWDRNDDPNQVPTVHADFQLKDEAEQLTLSTDFEVKDILGIVPGSLQYQTNTMVFRNVTWTHASADEQEMAHPVTNVSNPSRKEKTQSHIYQERWLFRPMLWYPEPSLVRLFVFVFYHQKTAPMVPIDLNPSKKQKNPTYTNKDGFKSEPE